MMEFIISILNTNIPLWAVIIGSIIGQIAGGFTAAMIKDIFRHYNERN